MYMSVLVDALTDIAVGAGDGLTKLRILLPMNRWLVFDATQIHVCYLFE